MRALSCIVLSLLAVPGAASAGELSRLGPLAAAPGEAVSGYLEVPAGDEGASRIPVSLIRGAVPGHKGVLFTVSPGPSGISGSTKVPTALPSKGNHKPLKAARRVCPGLAPG